MVFTQLPWLEYLERLWTFVSQAGFTKVLATSTSVYLAYKCVYALYFSPLRNIPGPFLARLTAKRAELFGMIGESAHKALEEYEKYGDVYVYEPNAVSISNPSDIRTVLGSHEFVKGRFYEGADLLGTPTTSSARDPHYAGIRRRQIAPYFSHAYLAKMEGAILRHGIVAIKEKWDELIEHSGDGRVDVNCRNAILYATFDTIGSLAFGKTFNALKNDDPTVSNWLNATMSYSGKRGLFSLLRYYPFSMLIEPDKRLYDELVSHAANCIAERRELLGRLAKDGEPDEKKPADLLQAFLDCQDPESKTKMSPIEVHAETVLMLCAASETTANSLMWTVHLLMLYPECYKRAVAEVRSAFGKDHLVTYSEAKAQLPYIEACIYESLRLAGVTGGQWPRIAPREGIALASGHFIPGGTEINVNISGANYNSKHWKNPHRFDPVRFIDDEEAKKNVFTFSYGVRVCPGRQLAWIEMLAILANMLKDYDIRLPDGYTEHGPNVLGAHGYPKLMDSVFFFVTMPKNSQRDCRVVVSKAQ